jgi:AcrR family transcriptional regulator
MSTGDARKDERAQRAPAGRKDERAQRTSAGRKGERAQRTPAERKGERARRRLEEADRRVERKMDQAKRRLEEAERRVEREMDRAGREVEEALGPIWARPEPGARRARFTREQIAETALAIADAEGFEAVSMRRVAAELGAGTMTLYHYVRTKDELVALMDNAIMGELLIPDGEMPSDWREALTLIARRTRDSLGRHPWTLEAMGDAQLGPNGIRHMDQSIAAVAGLDVDDVTRFEVISLVDDYVFGYAMRRRLPGPEEPEAMEEWLDRASAYIDEQVATGDFPALEAIMPEDGMSAFWKQLEEADFEDGRFERGLERLLDGIALDIERRRKSA